MKKTISLLLCVVLVSALAGCGSGSNSSGKAEKKGAKSSEAVSEPKIDPDSIDVDLTSLSSTMVYSEVSDMMTDPENYMGKTVKMAGQFVVYYGEETGKKYFACVIQDATACCAQGIEFVLADDYSYPDDYPKEEEEICVIGVFDTYQEEGETYCTLRNATLV